MVVYSGTNRMLVAVEYSPAFFVSSALSLKATSSSCPLDFCFLCEVCLHATSEVFHSSYYCDETCGKGTIVQSSSDKNPVGKQDPNTSLWIYLHYERFNLLRRLSTALWNHSSYKVARAYNYLSGAISRKLTSCRLELSLPNPRK